MQLTGTASLLQRNMEEETNLVEETEETSLPTDETTDETEEQSEEESSTLKDEELKDELERVKTTRTRKEKLLYTKQRVEKQLKEEFGDEEDLEDEEDKPLTIGMWKKMQEASATKTALDLADEITGQVERELVKFHIENTIRSTGNPQEDLRLARTLVNATKNKQIVEEISRKVPAKTHATSTSGTGAAKEKAVEFTKDELAFMRPPFNLSKEEILKARK